MIIYNNCKCGECSGKGEQTKEWALRVLGDETMTKWQCLCPCHGEEARGEPVSPKSEFLEMKLGPGVTAKQEKG